MRAATIQMQSTPDVARNLDAAHRLVASAAREGARLAVLPEYFCFMGRADADKLAVAETPGHGPIQRMLSEAAAAHGVWVIGGTLPFAFVRRALNCPAITRRGSDSTVSSLPICW